MSRNSRLPWRRPSSHRPILLPQMLSDSLPSRARGGRPASVDPSPAPPESSPSRSMLTSADNWLIGGALRAFQEASGLDEQQMAFQIGITPEMMRNLGLRRRPNPSSPTFAYDVECLAYDFRIDPDILMYLLAPGAE
jgi:hypothetical protein